MGASNAKGADEEQVSYWQMARAGYDEVVNAIIRPPRAAYTQSALGPAAFKFCDCRFVRKDLVLVNQRGQTLQCSHWEPLERPAEMPCVVYVHGNSSARVEVLNNLAVCLAIGATVFAFDCAGSGKSEGRFVSLGWFERDDLRVVVDHLRGSGTVSSIAVWGRSMGAVTGILYQAKDLELLGRMSVDAMVLDSPFADFYQLAEELVDKGKEHGVHVPKFVLRMVIHMVTGSVKKAAGFNINSLSPIQHASACTVPALFVTAENDDFISPSHAEQLYEAYSGAKNLVLVEGDHNSQRTGQCLHVAAAFLSKYLKVAPSCVLKDGDRHYGTLPWRNNTVLVGQALGDALAEDEAAGMGLTRERQSEIEGKVMGVFGGRKRANKSQDAIGSGEAGQADADALPANESGEARWRIDQAYYYCNRGNTLEEAGNVEAAIRSYRAAVSYMPTYADAYYNLGIALKSLGRLDEAVAEYKNAIRCKPDHADAHNNLGVAWEEKGFVEDAVECYQKAMTAKPDHSEAHCNLADALQSLGRLDEAVKEYQIAISYNSQDADAINNMGVALEAQGHFDSAIQAYTTAVAHRPTHWDAQCNLADALHARGQLDTAISLYRVIIQHCPTEASVFSSLGNALHANGEFDEAVEIYRQALRLNQSDAVTHNNLGIALQSTGKLEEAIRSYQSAITHNRNYAIAYYNLGVAWQSMDNLTRAVDSYRNALTCQTDYPDAYNNMGYALMSLGRIDEAISAYKSALRYRPEFESARENLDRAIAVSTGQQPPVTRQDAAKDSQGHVSKFEPFAAEGRSTGTKQGAHIGAHHPHSSQPKSPPRTPTQPQQDDESGEGSEDVLGRLSSSMQSFWGAAGF